MRTRQAALLLLAAGVGAMWWRRRREKARVLRGLVMDDPSIVSPSSIPEAKELLKLALHLCCPRVVERLLELHRELTAEDEDILKLAQLMEGTTTLEVLLKHRRRDVLSASSGTGWTAVMVAALAGNARGMAALLDAKAVPPAGYSLMQIAASNGSMWCVRHLLQRGGPHADLVAGEETALHLAARGGHPFVTQVLIKAGARIHADGNRMGATPLHLAATTGSWEACQTLLVHGAQASTKRKDGMTPLHSAAARGNAACCEVILKYFSPSSVLHERDRFGQTALHLACSGHHFESIKILVAHGADAGAADNDGITPAQCIVKRLVTHSSEDSSLAQVKETLLLLRPGLDKLDLSKASVLHMAACVPGEVGRDMMEFLLPLLPGLATQEDSTGWSPLHLAHFRKNEAGAEVLRRWLPAEYLASFNPSKPRQHDPTAIPAGIAAIPEADRRAVLNMDLTLQGIAKRIADGRSRNIIVLVGAGISVSCGIPDYRSKDGLYRQNTGGDIPYQRVFSEGFIRESPEGFYGLCKAVFGKTRTPSPTHYFLKMLHDHGILRRIFTQNIDGLEEAAGVPSEKVVQCHGSFSTSRCLDCNKEGGSLDESIMTGTVPKCRGCGGVLRPNVVFFGEALPDCFERRGEDFAACDLLIVMGTSLLVYPFAGLTQEVGPVVPRLLLNKEPTGPWKNRSQGMVLHNYRDVEYIGDCDEGVRTLTAELGWKGL